MSFFASFLASFLIGLSRLSARPEDPIFLTGFLLVLLDFLRLSSSLDEESLELLDELDESDELEDSEELDELDELDESSSELSLLLELSSLFRSFLILVARPFLPDFLVPGSVLIETGFRRFRDAEADGRLRRSMSGGGGMFLRRILRSSI